MSVRTVLLTGVGGPAGSSLAAQLAARGLRVHGVDLVDTPTSNATFEKVPAALDAAYSGTLLGIADRIGADLIIPTVTEELPVLAGLGDPRILVADPWSVAVAADKWLTCLVLSQAGVPVPRSVPICSFSDGLRSWIGLPVVTKPRVGRGGRGVQVHDEWFDADALPPDALVAEFAPGEEYCPNLFIADAATAQPESTPATPSSPSSSTPAPSTAQPEQSIAGALPDGSYTGQAVANRFGTWTVTVTISGGQLTDVQATSTPLDPKSDQISSLAIPQLTSEVIAAQSAEVNTISGATLTSRSYLTSLQSALDQAAS